VSYFYGPVHWTLDFLYRSVVMVTLSYLIAFVGALVINTLRVPWLLDAESGGQINSLEKRAEDAESSVLDLERQADKLEAAKAESKRLHDLFGSFMRSGIKLSGGLAGCQVKAQFEAWDELFDSWLSSVRTAISDMGFNSEAAEFSRAGENAEPIIGIRDARKEREERCSVLEQHQLKLEEIVHRRLP
jgi:hypothetical protein